MRRKQIFSDVDGVLLNMDQSYWRALGKVTGKEVYGAVHPWDYRQVAGISKEDYDLLWAEMWKIPEKPYGYVEDLIKFCRSNRIWMCACSVRPEGPPLDAAMRDFPQLGIPYTTFSTHKTKAEFIYRMFENADDDTDTLYIEDRWESADEMSRKGVRTLLVDRSHNQSKDIGVEYVRVFPHELKQAVYRWTRS